jgi:hypothetical protein
VSEQSFGGRRVSTTERSSPVPLPSLLLSRARAGIDDGMAGADEAGGAEDRGAEDGSAEGGAEGSACTCGDGSAEGGTVADCRGGNGRGSVSPDSTQRLPTDTPATRTATVSAPARPALRERRPASRRTSAAGSS